MSAPTPHPGRRRGWQAALGFVVPALVLGLFLSGLARPHIAGDGFGTRRSHRSPSRATST